MIILVKELIFFSNLSLKMLRTISSRLITRSNFNFRAFSSVSEPVVDATTAPATDKKARHTKVTQTHYMNVQEALENLKKASWASFDETVEINIVTGLDPRKPNQSIKGVAKLPNGTGKKVRICVITSGDMINEAIASGADVAGGDDIIKAIQGGDVNFDTVIASPEMMPMVGKIGKILGPRGLMPNPKVGTVTKNISEAVKSARAGAVSFKTDKKGLIQSGIGKLSFDDSKLIENIRSYMLAIMDSKPEGFKGKYLKKINISSTMGPGYQIELPFLDPNNPKFLLNLPGSPKK